MVLMLYYVAGVLLLFVVKNKYSRGNSKEQMQFLYNIGEEAGFFTANGNFYMWHCSSQLYFSNSITASRNCINPQGKKSPIPFLHV